MPAMAIPLASVGRIIGFDSSNWLTIGALVKAVLNFQNASSASQVHSHWTCFDHLEFTAFFSRSDIGVVTYPYFLIHCQ
jgi:hypothetical protein